jgi:single-strand DNA-binding protein
MEYTDSGVARTKFSVACNETWTDKTSGEKQTKTTWVDVTCWRGLATTADEYVTKGMLIYVAGKVEARAYMSRGEDPEPRASLSLTCRDMQFLSFPDEDEDYEESDGPDWDY